MTDKQKASNESPLCWVRPVTTVPDLGGFQVCREGEGFPVWSHPNGMSAPVSAGPAQSDCYKECAVGDSNYAAGMLLGWNLCVDNNEEKFTRIRGDRLRAAAQASLAAAQAQPLPDSLIPTAPDLEYLRGVVENTALPAFMRGNIIAALRWIDTLQTRLAHPYPAQPMQDWINQWPGLTNDEHTKMRAAWEAGFHAAQSQQPVSGADQFRDSAQMIEPSGDYGELPANITEALDLMDALLAPERGLLSVPYTSATVTAAREDLALIRAALAQQDVGVGNSISHENQELTQRDSDIPSWAYAGVTVWLGDKKVTKVAIQMDVELCRDDKLLRLFEGARFDINEANKELGQ